MIIRPIVTEKSTAGISRSRYVLAVDKQASKTQIARATEILFGVHVKKVQTINMPGKVRRNVSTRKRITIPGYKKAVIQLAIGEKIGIFETGK